MALKPQSKLALNKISQIMTVLWQTKYNTKTLRFWACRGVGMSDQAMTERRHIFPRLVNLPFICSLIVSGACIFVGLLDGTQVKAEELSQSRKENRSKFQYHDGKPEEKRQYVLPKVDVDPTNLTVEEMKARITHLEDLLEVIERLLLGAQATAR